MKILTKFNSKRPWLAWQWKETQEMSRSVIFRSLERSRRIKIVMDNNHDNSNPPERSKIKEGTAVWIIEKENYGTNKYKQGIVKDILSPRENHPRGIKVRLMDGFVGRVQWIME